MWQVEVQLMCECKILITILGLSFTFVTQNLALGAGEAKHRTEYVLEASAALRADLVTPPTGTGLAW
jgi:hypothetical protein